MLKQIILAGFGGQGVMLMGQLLAYGGMLEKKAVAWIPSYGPEMRGGTASCSVTISTSSISSPLVTEADVLVVMNRPSLEKYEFMLKPGGKLLINTSLVSVKASRSDIQVYYLPVNEGANCLGDSRVANMVMMGALLSIEPCINSNAVIESLKKTWPKNKHYLLPLNEEALTLGAKLAKEAKRIYQDTAV